MAERTYNVLFICTGNSARSIMAEALLNHWGKGRLRGFSAGTAPRGEVHPLTVKLLRSLDLATPEGMRSKSWDEFARADAPRMDFVFMVCDQAAAAPRPNWPGNPVTAHWGIPDPAAVTGSEEAQWAAFRRAFWELETRVKLFASLPIAGLDRLTLQHRLADIGVSAAQPTEAS
ncbi:MAG TPA: arsenate reductase ArsC [Candidatus Sulfotelmatobacter sp.]|nr:arsenate reductase ArsC [Candidatus Sulfotelmatobacter sp.]